MTAATRWIHCLRCFLRGQAGLVVSGPEGVSSFEFKNKRQTSVI